MCLANSRECHLSYDFRQPEYTHSLSYRFDRQSLYSLDLMSFQVETEKADNANVDLSIRSDIASNWNNDDGSARMTREDWLLLVQ